MDEAVRDMARYQSDVDINDEETAAIVAFLRTLTGEYKGVKLTNPNEYGVIHHHEDDAMYLNMNHTHNNE